MELHIVAFFKKEKKTAIFLKDAQKVFKVMQCVFARFEICWILLYPESLGLSIKRKPLFFFFLSEGRHPTGSSVYRFEVSTVHLQLY